MTDVDREKDVSQRECCLLRFIAFGVSFLHSQKRIDDLVVSVFCATFR